MAEGYLRRNDVGYPTQPNARGLYAIRLFEDADLAVLQVTVNTYLLGLPEATQRWTPHIVSIEYDNYTTTQAMPMVIHVCSILIFASGRIITPPTG